METFKETLRKIWYILYPFLFYYAVMLIIMTIAQWAFGGDATHYVFPADSKRLLCNPCQCLSLTI